MTLTAREKNLAIAVLVILLYLVCRISLGRFAAGVAALEIELSRISNDKHQAEIALKTGEPVQSVRGKGDASRPTMTLLSDLTASGASENVRVVGIERSSPTTFKLTLEGKFVDTMRFLSFIERGDGRFSVSGGELARPDASASASASEAKAPSRPGPGMKELRSLAASIPGGVYAPSDAGTPKAAVDAKQIHAVFNVSLKGGA